MFRSSYLESNFVLRTLTSRPQMARINSVDVRLRIVRIIGFTHVVHLSLRAMDLQKPDELFTSIPTEVINQIIEFDPIAARILFLTCSRYYKLTESKPLWEKFYAICLPTIHHANKKPTIQRATEAKEIVPEWQFESIGAKQLFYLLLQENNLSLQLWTLFQSTSLDRTDLLKAILFSIRRLSIHKNINDELTEKGAIEYFCDIARKNLTETKPTVSIEVVPHIFVAVGNLLFANPEGRKRLISCEGLEMVVKMIQMHTNLFKIVDFGLFLLGNVCYDLDEEDTDDILEQKRTEQLAPMLEYVLENIFTVDEFTACPFLGFLEDTARIPSLVSSIPDKLKAQITIEVEKKTKIIMETSNILNLEKSNYSDLSIILAMSDFGIGPKFDDIETLLINVLSSFYRHGNDKIPLSVVDRCASSFSEYYTKRPESTPTEHSIALVIEFINLMLDSLILEDTENNRVFHLAYITDIAERAPWLQGKISHEQALKILPFTDNHTNQHVLEMAKILKDFFHLPE